MVIILHAVTLGWEASVDWNDQNSFPPVHEISYWNQIETDVFSFLILLAWFKLLEFLSVFRKFSRLIVIFEMVRLPLHPLALPTQTSLYPCGSGVEPPGVLLRIILGGRGGVCVCQVGRALLIS
jgi:hypothetical protein